MVTMKGKPARKAALGRIGVRKKANSIVLLCNLPHCATENAACEELGCEDGEHRCRLGFSRD